MGGGRRRGNHNQVFIFIIFEGEKAIFNKRKDRESRNKPAESSHIFIHIASTFASQKKTVRSKQLRG